MSSEIPAPEESRAEGSAPPRALAIFVSDASAEAERIAQSLRTAGYMVVDVPLSMLVARVAVQRPRMILIDADADGALDAMRSVQELPESSGIDLLFVGRAGGALGGEEDAIARGGAGFFDRPVDVSALTKKVETLIGPGPLSIVPSKSASARPSLPPPSMRSPAPRASLSRPPPSIPRLAPLPTILPSERARQDSRPPVDSLYRRHASSQAPLSTELEQLLAEAEQRIGGNVVSESIFPSPDEEIAAVLPPEVLASLDEPLEDENNDDDEPHEGPRPVTTSGGRGATTGNEARAGKAVSEPAPPKTNSGTGGGGATTGARGSASDYARSGSSLSPRMRESESPVGSSGELQAERLLRTLAPIAPPSGIDAGEPISFGPRTIGDAALGVPLSVAPAQAMRGGNDRARITADAAPNVVPSVLGPGDAARALAYAISTRATGALCFETNDGVRRVVLREGDLVTAGSGFDGESLLAFLAERGDLPRDQIEKLIGRVPAFGRHAGAALVAYGNLQQDQLWPVLRAHAEWVLARALRIASGTARLEAEAPGRLRNEPSVFGGATGAEVFVEIVRRAIAPEDAFARLGGASVRLGEGPNIGLLAECALNAQLADRLANARGNALGDIFATAPEADAASVVFALTLLGVFEIIRTIGDRFAPTSDDREAAPSASGDLDEDALRARVRARMQLVEEGDYFAVLGIPREATGYEVRRAYVDLRRAFEPARILTPAIADLASDVRRITEVLDEAYEVLRDNARRERYRRAILGGYN